MRRVALLITTAATFVLLATCTSDCTPEEDALSLFSWGWIGTFPGILDENASNYVSVATDVASGTDEMESIYFQGGRGDETLAYTNCLLDPATEASLLPDGKNKPRLIDLRTGKITCNHEEEKTGLFNTRTLQLEVGVNGVGELIFEGTQIIIEHLPGQRTLVTIPVGDGVFKLDENITVGDQTVDIAAGESLFIDVIDRSQQLRPAQIDAGATRTLDQLREETLEIISRQAAATAEAAPTATPTAAPTPTPAAEATPTPRAVPTPTPAAVPTPTPAAVPTPTPAAVPTPTPAAVPTPTPAAVPTPTPAAVPTPTPAAVPTPTPAAVATPTVAADNPISPPPPQSGANEVVIAVADVGEENGRNADGSLDALKNLGLAESLFLRNPLTDATESWLATGWTLNPDLSSATINIDTSAEFQWLNDSGVVESLGNITAEDVAWSVNDANAGTNPSSIHGQAGDFAALWSDWRVVDGGTVEFDFVSFDSTWVADFTNESGEALSIFSKSVFESRGEDFARDNVVATGVYLVEEWIPDDRRTQVAVTAAGGNPHWKFTAKTDRTTFVEVPEAASRAALLKTGEVDIAEIEPIDVPQFTQGGFLTTSAGNAIQIGIFFSGNLWEATSAIDGSPLTRGTYVHDLAWIGNPNDPDDLQEAKSVRNALARSVDRDAINATLLGGLGRPVQVEYVSSAHSRWQEKWNYDYTPDLARKILRGESVDWPIPGGASYRQDEVSDSQQDLLNGNAFSVSIYAGPELQGGTGLNGEIADAVAGYWADLGLLVFTLKFPYANFRPTIVDRTNTHPWATSCVFGRESNPWHFPKGLVQTSLTRGGFSCGFEIPFVLENYQETAREPDETVRNQLVDDYVEYMYEEALQPGIVAAPELWVMNPRKVKSWNMGKRAAGNIGRVWNLELQ